MKGSISKKAEGRAGAPWVVRYPAKPRPIWKSFWAYEDAENFLITLNYRDQNEDAVDQRDYAKGNPLGVVVLSEQWLEYRRIEGLRSLGELRLHIRYFTTYFGNANIKAIQYGQLEDFFNHLRRTTDLSSKTLYNINTTIKTFFKWVARRERHVQAPEFPEIRYELSYRKTLGPEEQSAVIEEVRRIAWKENPKIYFGILWLATYPVVRPIELIHVLEGDIDLTNGFIIVTHNKVPGQYKRIYLIDEDVDTIKSFPRGLPHIPFFRYEKKKGQPHGKRFGKGYLNNWWKRACDNLGIKGVPLYPGTKHSTVTNLGDTFSPEQIMQDASGHATNKAFARYFQERATRRRAVGAHIRAAHNLHTRNVQGNKGKWLKS